MLESTLVNFTNPNYLYNCTHWQAWNVAQKLCRPGWHNLRYWFWPPEVKQISLIPQDPKVLATEPNPFDISMFTQQGLLHERPLNHWLEVTVKKNEKPVLINAGYLMQHFLLDPPLGYAEYKRLLAEGLKAKDIILDESTSSDEG